MPAKKKRAPKRRTDLTGRTNVSTDEIISGLLPKNKKRKGKK